MTAVGEATLEAGTYEVLRARLAEQAAGLARRAEALNARRLEAFGSAELTLLGTERIRTEHNCVPRDVVQVAGLMLFGLFSIIEARFRRIHDAPEDVKQEVRERTGG